MNFFVNWRQIWYLQLELFEDNSCQMNDFFYKKLFCGYLSFFKLMLWLKYLTQNNEILTQKMSNNVL